MAAFGQSPFNKPATPGFGTPPATNPFGAPASGGLFGSPAPGFGQAPATTGFGVQQQQTAGAFSFAGASMPAFGGGAGPGQQQQQQTTSPFGGFGAVSTPLLFGQPQSAAAPSLFGTPASAAAPSPFGGSSLFSAAQPNSSAFGSSGPAFGSTFGAASQPTSVFSFAPAITTGGFGVQGQQQQQQVGFSNTSQMAPAAYGSNGTPDAAVKEIVEIRNAYDPKSPTFKFHHLFLNVVDHPQQRVKPLNVDEMRWRQALAQAGGPHNPDRLWPVLATGFQDLRLRAQAQQQAIQENATQLQRMNDQAVQLGRRHTLELRQRSAAAQRKHIELSHRLLKCCRNVDALEARLATSLGYRGDLSRAKEQGIARHLAVVETELGPAAGAGLQRRLEAVAASARLRVGGPHVSAAQGKLDDGSVQQLFAVLKEHAVAIKHLQAVLRRDQLDVSIMAAADASDGPTE